MYAINYSGEAVPSLPFNCSGVSHNDVPLTDYENVLGVRITEPQNPKTSNAESSWCLHLRHCLLEPELSGQLVLPTSVCDQSEPKNTA